MVFNSSVRRRDAWSAATREDGRTGVRAMQTEAEATCSSRPKPSQAYAPPKLFRVLVVGTMDRRLLYGSQAVRHQRPTPRSQPSAIWAASKHWASAVLRLHLPSSDSLGVPQKQSKKSKRAVAHPPNAAHRGGAAKLESNTLRQGLLSLISASWLRCGGAPCRSRGFCTSVRSLCLPIKHATSRCTHTRKRPQRCLCARRVPQPAFTAICLLHSTQHLLSFTSVGTSLLLHRLHKASRVAGPTLDAVLRT